MFDDARKVFSIKDLNKVCFSHMLAGRAQEIHASVITYWASLHPSQRRDQQYYRRYESDWSNPEK
jgi:hypothetical protein